MMDSDLLKYGGFRGGKIYRMDSDGRAVELGRPQEIKFEVNKSNDMFTEVKGIATWADPILPSSIYDELAKQVVRYGEDRFIRRVYGLPEHYIINNGATILFWKDGTKTIVKRSKDEKFDKRLGFLTAYFQKHCGMSKTKANKFLDTLEVDE